MQSTEIQTTCTSLIGYKIIDLLNSTYNYSTMQTENLLILRARSCIIKQDENKITNAIPHLKKLTAKKNVCLLLLLTAPRDGVGFLDKTLNKWLTYAEKSPNGKKSNMTRLSSSFNLCFTCSSLKKKQKWLVDKNRRQKFSV